jgi:transcriptional regulator with XRE-family HTH domain
MDSIDKINHILVERNMSGAELSRQIGVSSGVFSQWNTKRTKPSLRNISKIAAVLDVPVGVLMPDSETEATKKASSEDEAEGDRIATLRKRLEALSEEDLDKLIAMMDVLGM